jgi:DNA topoisomerase VI subunit A
LSQVYLNFQLIKGSKGLAAGNLFIQMKSGHVKDFFQAGHQGILIPHDHDIQQINTTAIMVLVIEKESSFQKLLQLDIIEKCNFNILVVTGKGTVLTD